MDSKTKKWIELGIVLEKNPNAIVTCPNCGIGNIEVVDQIITGSNKIDRYLICNNCKSWNVITMSNDEQ